MKNSIATAVLALTIFPASGTPETGASVAIFNGETVDKSVDAFLKKYGAREDLTEFSVASQGGEILASIRLAKWIKSKNLDVRVRAMCFSACANYLFVAGKAKIIEDGAFVGWHGDAEQKDFREIVKLYTKLLKKRESGGQLTRAEIIHLKKHKIHFGGLMKAQRAQAEFYRSVGVNPLVGRFGQEPVNYPSDGWTFTVRAMKLLGIQNVTAHRNYGDDSYFQTLAVHAALVNGGPMLVFDSLDGKTITANLPF